jgi:hypothetical protein
MCVVTALDLAPFQGASPRVAGQVQGAEFLPADDNEFFIICMTEEGNLVLRVWLAFRSICIGAKPFLLAMPVAIFKRVCSSSSLATG